LQAKKGQFEIRETTFNLPSVEVGSILEFYFQVRANGGIMPNPDWEIQGKYPVRHAKYLYAPLPDLLGSQGGGWVAMDEHGQALSDFMWYVNLPGGKTIAPNASKRFELELSDIPPLPHEQWAPPTDSQRYEVRFYYAPGNSVGQYWTSEGGYWLKDVGHFAEVSGSIKSAAASVVAPGDSDTDKAKKLYAAVQGFENTDFTRKKSDAELKNEGLKAAKKAEDTWAQRSGSGEDLALLYLALLRGAGLTAYPMKVVDRERGIFKPNYLNWHQLDATVVILSTGGQEIVLDPGEKMCPFQMVSWRHSGAGGVRQQEKGIAPWATPLLPYTANTVIRRAELTVSADGQVTGKLKFAMNGQDALYWRQKTLREDEDRLKKDFDEWLKTQVPAGMEAHLTGFANLDNPNADLNATATVTGAPGSTTGKRILLPGSFFTTSEDSAFISQPNRQQPVDMHYAMQVKDGVLYHLPAGFALETATGPTASVPWPGTASFVMKSTTNGSDLTVMTSLARAFTFLEPDEYGQLRDFYQKVAAADQQQLVLHATEAPKGN
jgi:transglutaminase-like putative cysteine protease